MDKLGLGQYYGNAAASAPGLGVEPVSPGIVFDVASLVLYGTHAVPVRLKILMDRLFSVLRDEEVAQILKGYGWTREDYQRGYILKVNGNEIWQIKSSEIARHHSSLREMAAGTCTAIELKPPTPPPSLSKNYYYSAGFCRGPRR